MTQNSTTTDSKTCSGGISAEQVQQLAEASRKAGTSVAKAITAFSEKLPAVINAFSQTAKAVLIVAQTLSLELAIRTKATPKEWYMMNHGKRRTRKKYRNRVYKRMMKGEPHDADKN